jgi:Protein of unknown function (DUF1559)
MPSFCISLFILTLAQNPAPLANDPQVNSVAPFVGADVFAVVQIDLTRMNAPDVAAQLFANLPPEVLADTRTATLKLIDDLHRAGARELDLLYSITDMPGSPFAVVPLSEGADAGAIGAIFATTGKGSGSRYPASATVHSAVVAGSQTAVARVRAEKSTARPELSAALTAFGEKSLIARVLLVPSQDTRRVLEEMVPTFPLDLGGGPVTDLTRGVLWAAVGLDGGQKPWLVLVVETPNADASRTVVRLGENLIAYLRKSPAVENMIPGLAKLLPEIKPEIAGNRITFKLEAQRAAALVDGVLAPVRSSAMFRQCINNEKHLGLAFHRYHQRHNTFPPAYSSTKDGKPLLSWRVLILPFLDENALYQQFHLDEAWDSPHNRALIARMPADYHCPFEGHDMAAAGKTRYLAPRGAGTILRGADPVSYRAITDGTSNTILAIDASDDQAVSWTEPRDLDVDLPLAVEQFLKTPAHHGRVALFADGAVRTLRESIAPATLRMLFTAGGNETINPDDL